MSKSAKTPKKLRPSIRYDGINPSDYFKYNFVYCCEQCSHFDSTEGGSCTLGYYSVPHRQEIQLKHYELNGTMALCRFLEID